MEISHVLRAEEWLPSTPKHLYLYESFGWIPPQYAHLPLILSPKGGKLSKRDGAVSAQSYLDDGYLPEAVLNFIAFLGWNPKTTKEIFSLDELVKEFSIEHINKAGAVFDRQRLDHLNGLYIRTLDQHLLAKRLIPFYQQAGIPTDDVNKLARVTALIKDRMVTLKEAGELARFVFELPDYDPVLLLPKQEQNAAVIRQNLELAKSILEKLPVDGFNAEHTKAVMINAIDQAKLTNVAVLWPLRVALSGQAASPGVFEIAAVLGKEETLRRVVQAISKLRG
jgi:glutamyl/glutaminyl-tRNA synthetase